MIDCFLKLLEIMNKYKTIRNILAYSIYTGKLVVYK